MKNIILTGLMGSGKTTVGRILSQKLKYDFIDTDAVIEKQEKMSINEIFKTKGEKYFRKLENEVCKKLSTQSYKIISTGGGIVLNKENISLLRKNGIIINLQASSEKLWERIKNNSNRPLLKNNNPIETLKNLLKERDKYYKNADFFIDTENKNVNDIVEIILNIIKEKNL